VVSVLYFNKESFVMCRSASPEIAAGKLLESPGAAWQCSYRAALNGCAALDLRCETRVVLVALGPACPWDVSDIRCWCQQQRLLRVFSVAAGVADSESAQLRCLADGTGGRVFDCDLEERAMHDALSTAILTAASLGS